jgi:aminopeptidase N
MDKRHSTYLFFMGGEYAIVKDKWKNVPVDYYIEKDEPYAKQIYGNTPEMIDFSEMNYDIHGRNTQISGRNYVSGAMENTTATFMEVIFFRTRTAH